MRASFNVNQVVDKYRDGYEYGTCDHVINVQGYKKCKTLLAREHKSQTWQLHTIVKYHPFGFFDRYSMYV